MKRHLIYSIAFVALMASCVKEPTIYLRLPDEDAAAIPYQTGQMLNFIDQDGDTLLYIVTYDETKPFSDDYWDYAEDSKMSIIQQPWCYARTVQLRCYSDSTTTRMMFTVLPDKIFYFNWNYQINIPYYDLNGATETVEVNGETYENVHVSSYSGDFWHVWYYSEEVGLIAVKNEGHSLTLVR
jgi:hypothetical protein